MGWQVSTSTGPTHLPPPHIPSRAPSPPNPPFRIAHSPPWRHQLLERTHICERTIGQLPIPFILDFGDLARGLVVEDVDLAADSLLLVDAFYDVAGLEVHADRVAAVGDFVVEALDLGEGAL